MNYLLKTKRPMGKKKIAGFAAALVLAALVIWRPNFFGNFLATAGAPIWQIKNAIAGKFSGVFSVFYSNDVLWRENQKIKMDLDSASAALLELDTLKKENAGLKNALGRIGDSPRTLASVLSAPPASLYDTMIIDVGAQSISPVSAGDLVLSGDYAVGEINQVFKTTSRVGLLSSPGRKVSVLIGTNNLRAEAEGLGGGGFSVSLPKDAQVAAGDAVVLPGIDAKFFGFVNAINSTEQDSFKTVYFKSPVNFNNLKWVEVMPQSFQFTQ